jgi:predicted tellurium resistance membrane protein TerC
MVTKMAKIQSATSLEVSPEQERRSRMIKYSVAMTIRMVCIVVGVLVQGPLMWIAFAGAIFLPYFAVVIANSPGKTKSTSTLIAPKLTISNEQIRIVDDK